MTVYSDSLGYPVKFPSFEASDSSLLVFDDTVFPCKNSLVVLLKIGDLQNTLRIKCNGADLGRSTVDFKLYALEILEDSQFEPIASYDDIKDSASEILKD
jgi:hypothetical protein